MHRLQPPHAGTAELGACPVVDVAERVEGWTETVHVQGVFEEG